MHGSMNMEFSLLFHQPYNRLIETEDNTKLLRLQKNSDLGLSTGII